MPVINSPTELPWEPITVIEEIFGETQGTWVKESRRVLLLSPSWHCTKPLR